MRFYRDSERGLQRVERSGVETWLEHAEEVRAPPHFNRATTDRSCTRECVIMALVISRCHLVGSTALREEHRGPSLHSA